MIDTHAHLDFSEFDKDRDEVIARFFSRGGKAIINIGVDLERSRKSIEIAEKYEGVFASVGLHPDFFSQVSTDDPRFDLSLPTNKSPEFLKVEPLASSSRSNIFLELKKLAKHEKVVAIGETGLDYYRIGAIEDSKEIRDRQKKGFLAQIGIAQELGLPVIVHCRNAWEDVYAIVTQNSNLKIKNHNAKLKTKKTMFVLHCYSGGKQDTEKFLKFPNICFSFCANITYPKPVERSRQFEEVIKMIPLDKILLDSDSPFLAPQEKRGQRNEPINVMYIAKIIAEIKKLSISEVEASTDKNAVDFFKLNPK